jgi:uncharacterized protein (TIGR03083 family)
MDWIDELTRATDAFADLLDEADLDSAVPACPGWTLLDLADHLGGVHQWARHAVVAGNPDGEAEPAPRERAALAAWYRTHAGRLVQTLKEVGADAPAWTFGPEPHTAAFWQRRQVHETLVHTWDGWASQGRHPALDPVLALDGVDEAVNVFYPRQVRLGRTEPLPAGLGLVAADAPGHPGFAIGTTPDVTIEATASTLLLLLWHRVDLAGSDVQVTGDAAHAADLLRHAITP